MCVKLIWAPVLLFGKIHCSPVGHCGYCYLWQWKMKVTVDADDVDVEMLEVEDTVMVGKRMMSRVGGSCCICSSSR